MEDWVNKISFHAQLPPSLQLLSYDESQKVSGFFRILINQVILPYISPDGIRSSNLKQGQNTLERVPAVGSTLDVSSGSSRGSSPESSPRRPNTLPTNSFPRGTPGAPQAHHLQQQHRLNNNLPPQVVPRSAPPPIPLRSPTTEVTTDGMRIRAHGKQKLLLISSFNCRSRIELGEYSLLVYRYRW